MKHLIIVGALVPSICFSSPTAKYEGGRYYLYKDGERQEQYYTQDYTAKAAAVNLSFRCMCPVVIQQPIITVTTSFNLILLTWERANAREDGSPLAPEEISHYQLEVNGKEYTTKELSFIVSDPIIGENRMRIATVDSDGTVGAYSEFITVNIE